MVILDKILGKFGFVRGKSWEKLWAAGKTIMPDGITQQNAYKQDLSVYKGIKAISDNVPQAELIFKDWESEKEIYPKDWVNLFEKPNPLMSYNLFIKSVVGCIALDGGVYIVKTGANMERLKSPLERPQELWVYRVKDGSLIVEDGVFKGYRIKNTRYQPHEVAYPRDFNPDSVLQVVSGLTAGKNILNMDYEAQRHNVNFFKNGGTPGITLETEGKLTEEQRKALKKQLDAKIQGTRNSFVSFVLEQGTKLNAFSPTHKEMDFIEQLRYTREEILGIWRVPKALLNITEDINYATFLGQIKAFWQYGIMPILRMVEDSFNSEIIRPIDRNVYCEFDISNVPAFREDFKEQVQTAKELFAMGFTANEINEKFGWGFENKEWRDKWWIPLSQVPAGEGFSGDFGMDYTEPEKTAKPEQKQKMESDKKELIQKAFLMKHSPIEQGWAKKLSRFFFEQRADVLAVLNGKGVKGLEDSIDWEEQDKKLIKYSLGFIEDGVRGGVNFGLSLVGADSSDMLKQRADMLVKSIAQQVTRVNKTVKRQLQNTLLEGISEGETTTQLADRVRNVYNMAANRSMTIARTETTRAMNGGADIYYADVGVEKVQWLTAGDEAVRETHQMVDGEVVVRGQMFSNGLLFPGDPNGSAGETISCRCSLLPLID